MRAGVGYSENPDTATAGFQVAASALRDAGRTDPCDLALLFSTARHDPWLLRDSIAAVIGPSTSIVGGATVGAISNDRFGYAGDQVILALIWLDEARCDILVEDRLEEDEGKAGQRLGQKLGELGVTQASSVVLFYDAIFRSEDDFRMIMATPLLAGIEQGLGGSPDLIGAGLMGDYACSATWQWAGDRVTQHTALALVFSGDIRVDSVIMHGCRPATGYYTVTKADRQTVLEINNRPALRFIDELLDHAIPVENYAFFLTFGMKEGDKWGDFQEEDYANHLCLAIDKEREGIVMFEPNMVEGSEFQIMRRGLDLDYIPPKIEKLFADLGDRKPVFALYIDCAGRAAGYAGIDLEDAVAVQEAVGGRVPLLGLYTGVEIAPVNGRSRGLDWTGVFCLLSTSGQE
ncbi:hypothetical protein FACS1894205_0670 [Alphaproteobacteria bacterium]|nr:hypothetical protein FACS1894205_0670 [Alphaproteobacteria bacterium]